MPEAPEVKISIETLKSLIQNKPILSCKVHPTSRYKITPPDNYDLFVKDISLNKIKVLDVSCKGKFSYWSFTNDWYMFCTYGMSGQWSTEQVKHPCISFEYEIPPLRAIYSLYFNDPRHFGTIKFVQGKQYLDNKLQTLGWDILSSPLTYAMDDKEFNYIVNELPKSKKTIAEVLMKQSLFAGCGNYIKSEALYVAQISPWRICSTLSLKEIKNICEFLTNVAQESYKNHGATISTYQTIYGDKGNYSNFFKVYSRKLDPLGNQIIKEKTPDGRSTYWVPSLQK